jgi:hypothetical protein
MPLSINNFLHDLPQMEVKYLGNLGGCGFRGDGLQNSRKYEYGDGGISLKYDNYTQPKLDFKLDTKFPKTEVTLVVGDKRIVHRTHKLIAELSDPKQIATEACTRVYSLWNSLLYPFIFPSYKNKLDSLRPYFRFKNDEKDSNVLWVKWSLMTENEFGGTDTRLYKHNYDTKTGNLKIRCGYATVNKEIEVAVDPPEVKSAVELWAMHMSLVESYNPFMDKFLMRSRDALPGFTDPQVYSSRIEMMQGMHHKQNILSTTTENLVVR